MMGKTAFIAGPIQGVETQQGYREIITQICKKLGFKVMDPWLREKVIYRKDDPCWWDKVPVADFIQRDLEDAEKCDIMIVYLPKLSAGACMELFYAKRKGKKIIIVSEIDCLSPWLVYHSDSIVKSFEDLEKELEKIKN